MLKGLIFELDNEDGKVAVVCSGSSSSPGSSLQGGFIYWCISGMPRLAPMRTIFNSPFAQVNFPDRVFKQSSHVIKIGIKLPSSIAMQSVMFWFHLAIFRGS